MSSVDVAIVTFRTPLSLLQRCVDSVRTASARAGVTPHFALADNAVQWKKWPCSESEGRVYFSQGNVGFGRANNLIVESGSSEWLLFLNPDAAISEQSLHAVFSWVREHPDVVALVPAVIDENGRHQYVHRRCPRWRDILLRGVPGYGRFWGRKRQDYYELRDKDWTQVREDFAVASGCCLLVRRAAFEQINGFDPEFFLYFEDYDLSLRLRALGRLVYLPFFCVTHLGGNTASKSWQHWRYFLASARRFMRKHPVR